MASQDVIAERARCAALCADLASIWEASAERIRQEGTFTVRELWPPFFGKKVQVVRPGWERAAKDLEAAAHGLRTVQRGITEGWTRK